MGATATQTERAARPLAGRLAEGAQVGRFLVVRLLAEGGMGCVYEVVDPSIEKHFVIKTLQRELAGSPAAAERMRLEQRALAELDHPNIVQIITAGEHERSPYLVMEKLGGVTLRRALEPSPSGVGSWAVACAIAAELLEALASAHEHPLGIVHRDVKPENVFVIESRGHLQVKLVDFGIASLSNSAKQTVGLFRGTPRYAAPEQLRGERVTPATDVYAVGLVLFEMIAGKDPFWSDRQLAIGRAHLEKSPPAVSTLAQFPVPPALDALIARALAKSPGERPPGAKAFAAELRALVRAEGRDAFELQEAAFVERIRTLETVASTHDLLAGLGAGDDPAASGGFAAQAQAHAEATEVAGPPEMTRFEPGSTGTSGQLDIEAPARAPRMRAGWLVAGAVAIAGLAFAAGRAHGPEGTAPAGQMIVPTAPLALASAPPAATALATTGSPAPVAALATVAATSAPSPSVAPMARPHATTVAKPKKKSDNVDGVPHVASGL